MKSEVSNQYTLCHPSDIQISDVHMIFKDKYSDSTDRISLHWFWLHCTDYYNSTTIILYYGTLILDLMC